MPREILQTGDTWTEEIANGVASPRIGTANEWGEIPLIRDEDHDLDPTQQFTIVNKYLNRIKCSVTTGLQVAYTSAYVLSNKQLFLIEAGTLSIPINSLGFIFIQNAEVRFNTVLPDVCLPLAIVQTNSSNVILLTDIRHQAIEREQSYSLPPQIQPFKTGDLKFTLQPVLEAGWLRAGIFVNSLEYPELFAIFGYRYGQSGTNFKLPGDEDLTLGFAGSPGSLGMTAGTNTAQLDLNNLPRHSHSYRDFGHNHAINDPGHNHFVNDGGHNHQVNDPGHGHQSANLRAAALNSNENDNVGAEISSQGQGNFLRVEPQTTGIRLTRANANISLNGALAGVTNQPSTTGIQINEVGNSQPISTLNKRLRVYWLIKT
jgi:microcystin-dependent protein